MEFDFSIQIFKDFGQPTKKGTGMKKTVNINNIILKQLKHRYELVVYNGLTSNQKSYGIIDSIYPYEKIVEEIRGGNVIKGRAGCMAISERVAKETQVPQMHISDLVAIFGYSKANIRDILMNVKKKKFELLVIGYGGTGTNFLHWFSKMAEWVNINRILNDLVLVDDDKFDSINLLRVPFILPEVKNGRRNKINYFKDYAHISRETYISNKRATRRNLYRDHIYYGAPDLETRKMLDEEKIAFVAATHRDNACALMLRPELDTELMVETYGKIGLTPFFLNHIKMTISFLEYLGHEDTTMESMKGKEKSILKYDFVEANKDFCDNGGRFGNRTIYPVIPNEYNTTDIEIGD